MWGSRGGGRGEKRGAERKKNEETKKKEAREDARMIFSLRKCVSEIYRRISPECIIVQRCTNIPYPESNMRYSGKIGPLLDLIKYGT